MTDKIPDAQPIAVKPKPAPEPLPIDAEVVENIRKTAHLPTYITVTYLDAQGKLRHFQQISRNFQTDDILPALVAIGEDADRNLIQPKAILSLPRK